jgi:serine/threonine protein kinase
MASESTQHSGSALPSGYEFCGFRIERVLGQGGFGFTYLAHEQQLDRRVAIKEFYPRHYVIRIDHVRVVPRHAADRPRFDQAKLHFLEEARRLARFDHGNIVRIQRLLEDHHGTAYFVMDFIEGRNFEQWIQAHRSPSEGQLKPILLPLLDGLEYLHFHGVFHQDVSPENILINRQERPILIDFGSAQEDCDDRVKNKPAVTRAGYSAYEQYVAGPKGPCTDLYALASVMIHAITGKPPPAALDRRTNSAGFRSMAERYRGRYSASFLHALDRAFAIMPGDRPQTVAEFRRLLVEPGQLERTKPGILDWLGNPWVLAGTALAIVLALLVLILFGGPVPPPSPPKPTSPVAVVTPPPPPPPSVKPPASGARHDHHHLPVSTHRYEVCRNSFPKHWQQANFLLRSSNATQRLQILYAQYPQTSQDSDPGLRKPQS